MSVQTESFVTDEEILQAADRLSTNARAVIECSHLEEMSALVTSLKRALAKYDDLKMLAARERGIDKNTLQPPARLVNRYWSDISRYQAVAQEFKRHLINLCGMQQNHYVLDVGCGIGRIAVALVDYLIDGRYEGFDIIAKGINWCNENITPRYPNFRFRVADIYNRKYNSRGKQRASAYTFPYYDDQFDIVVLTSVFTHMRPDAIEHYLNEIARVLRVGGKCLITWYLLTPRTRKLMTGERSIFNFKHKLEGFFAIDPKRPNNAIALNGSVVKNMYVGSGLRIDAIHNGYWPNLDERANVLSSQDMIVATK